MRKISFMLSAKLAMPCGFVRQPLGSVCFLEIESVSPYRADEAQLVVKKITYEFISKFVGTTSICMNKAQFTSLLFEAPRNRKKSVFVPIYIYIYI